jgi:ABC-type Fe3+ transport system substrate-binding protein
MLAVIGSALGRHSASATELVVVTSFPSTLYEPFRRAFESREPGIRLVFLNRKTTTAVAMVGHGAFEGADVFWASAPDAFEVLKAKGQLAVLNRPAPLPRSGIGSFPIDDPDGRFRGFTVSGYGVSWNASLLERLELKPPRSIAGLIDPRYRGLIAMSAPSRSGTTHLMVETVLQRSGWEQGWSIWLGITGNLATVTARSFSVTSGVTQGRFAIGLSIDFLGQGDGGNVRFAYPEENVFLPGSIAVFQSARNADAGRRFAEFVLGEEGQRLLTDPRIGRNPVSPLQDALRQPDLFELADARTDAFAFDARLSGRRYELVNILFDELITERLARLQRFWRRHAELSARAERGTAITQLLAEAGLSARRLPPAVARIGSDGGWPDIRRVPRGTPLPPDQAAFVEELRAGAEAQLAAAERLLERAAQGVSDETPGLPGTTP